MAVSRSFSPFRSFPSPPPSIVSLLQAGVFRRRRRLRRSPLLEDVVNAASVAGVPLRLGGWKEVWPSPAHGAPSHLQGLRQAGQRDAEIYLSQT